MMRLLLTIIFSFSIMGSIMARQGLGDPLLSPVTEVNVTTPNVSGLLNFSNTPVDIASGTTKISVTIHTISLPGLTVPISLDYFSGGVKVEEVSSDVGLSWSLNAGGVINKSSKGRVDYDGFNYVFPDSYQSFNPNDYSSNFEDYEWMKYRLEYCEDLEPDMFSFNFLGKSGKLFYDDEGSLIPYPFENMKFSQYSAIDDKGNQYFFEAGEGAFVTSLCPGALNTTCLTEYSSNANFLTKVITASQDTVWFDYENIFYSYASSVNETVYEMTTLGLGCQIPTEYDYTICVVNNSVSSSRLRQIRSTRGHLVEFKYNTESRLDLPGTNALKQIVVKYDATPDVLSDSLYNQIIKVVDLYQSYVNGPLLSHPALEVPSYTAQRLVLDSVVVDSEQVYQFDYNGGLPGRLNFSQDYYGYYNGLGSSTFLPSINGYPITYSGANRQVNQIFASVGLMNKIIYPTGGYSTFAYEGNPVGGARVKTINNYDQDNTLLLSKGYEYYGDISQGMLFDYMFVQTKRQRQSHNELGYLALACDYAIITSSPSALEAIWPRSIKYAQVDEYITGESNGKISHYFTSKHNIIGLPNALVFETDESVYSGLPLKNEYYSYSQEFGYRLVSSDSTVYRLHTELEGSPPSLVPSHNQPIRRALRATQREPEIEATFDNIFYPAQFDWRFYYYYSAFLAPVKKISRSYSSTGDGSYLESIVDLSYDSLQATLISEKVNNSDGTEYSKSIRYAYHFDDPVYQNMVNNHIYSEPVIETYATNGMVYQGVAKTMKEVQGIGSNRFVPSGSYIFDITEPVSFSFPSDNPASSSSNLEQKLSNTVFDDRFGNLISYRVDDVPYTNLYDYNGLYPVMQCSNCTNATVAITSFETQEKGGWSYTGSSIESSSSKTGRRVYDLSSGAISKSGLASATYELSFWAKAASGSQPWTFMGQTETLTSEWQLIRRQVTGASITISGNNILIDEVRLHPVGSQMSTYTYDPLVGVTSMTDANHVTVYYEYDYAQRLKCIKDEKGNILQQFEYNYYSAGNE
ncbi:hypothetical protein [Penaeicola halotolerans]|uniref:hypothetical protein n=1 Tax=Penaeicola halotolerans TaxID=2793196 RepID=UPI001CF8CC68|nr:hypothetical protein [Penaeicola halotolerans]